MDTTRSALQSFAKLKIWIVIRGQEYDFGCEMDFRINEEGFGIVLAIFKLQLVLDS